jgi:hypothetical protein
MAFLCVSQQGEFKNTIKNFLEKIHVKSLWPKKLREKKTFFLSSFPVDFFIAFLAVSLHEEELENTTKTFWRKSEKVERKKKLFPFVFSRRFFLITFLAVSLHKEPKNTIKIFSKIGPENLKKSQKR